MILHEPVPIVGVLAANVVVVLPHIDDPVWSGPASAIVGLWVKVIVTSSVEGGQGELLIVQRKTYVVPAVPVKLLVGLEGDVIVPPVPETMLHNPVPIKGVFPAREVDVNPHIEGPV
jgi:hypothetical protein